MNKVTQRPDIWTTFNGRQIEPAKLDHQHLTNIYWYHKLVFNIEHVWALEIIRERYNGQLLPYSPHVDSTPEIRALEEKGILHWNLNNNREAITVGTLTFNHQLIGTIWKYNS